MIASSEKKISALGVRLLHTVKDNLKEDFLEDSGDKSQNSTIKLGSKLGS